MRFLIKRAVLAADKWLSWHTGEIAFNGIRYVLCWSLSHYTGGCTYTHTHAYMHKRTHPAFIFICGCVCVHVGPHKHRITAVYAYLHQSRCFPSWIPIMVQRDVSCGAYRLLGRLLDGQADSHWTYYCDMIGGETLNDFIKASITITLINHNHFLLFSITN